MSKSSWDLCIERGDVGEDLVEYVMTGDRWTIEVKNDSKWFKTNNLFVEVRCWSPNKGWYPSGLRVSEADYWSFVVEGTILSVPTKVLKATVAEYGRYMPRNKAEEPSAGFLITADNLFKMTRKFKGELDEQ